MKTVNETVDEEINILKRKYSLKRETHWEFKYFQCKSETSPLYLISSPLLHA